MDMGHTFCFLKKPIHSGLIFCTYGTGKTCSFWPGVTIYGHKVTYIVFLKNPVHSGLRSPYMVIKRTFCFWKSLFILDWSDLIWAWYTQSHSLEAVSTASKIDVPLPYYLIWSVQARMNRPFCPVCAKYQSRTNRCRNVFTMFIYGHFSSEWTGFICPVCPEYVCV